MTIKVHKDPYKFRPIVATCGTVLSALSSWLDYKLQQLKPYISTYIKDSDDFRKQVHELGPLPPNARIITADAKSMYTNIDTDHALEILRSFLEELEAEGKLPLDFDIDMILEAAALVVRWNIFEFGYCYFKQLIGTAMGTAAAVLWAIIYYYWHEKHVLIAKWSKKMPLLKRFVDDIFAIIKVGGQDGMTADEWKIFKNDINSFGILEWDIDEPSKQVDFLDLTLWIDGDKILTKTYQKPINLYQYITPTSAHPPGMIKSMIFGSLRRYFEQNSRTEDFWTIAMQLYHRLKARGWDRATLEPIFIAAYQRIQSPRQHQEDSKPKDLTNWDPMILHIEYHPDDMPRRKIRELYEKYCAEQFEQVLGIKRTIVAYSRPRNLRDLLQSAKLYQMRGKEVSTFYGD